MHSELIMSVCLWTYIPEWDIHSLHTYCHTDGMYSAKALCCVKVWIVNWKVNTGASLVVKDKQLTIFTKIQKWGEQYDGMYSERKTKISVVLHGLTMDIWLSYQIYLEMLSKYLTDEYLPTTEGQLTVQSLSVWYSASYILSSSYTFSSCFSTTLSTLTFSFSPSLEHQYINNGQRPNFNSALAPFLPLTLSLSLSLSVSLFLFCVGEVLMGV